jgi:aconitate hydratase
MTFDIDMIKKMYKRYPKRVFVAKQITEKPLILSKKVLYTHLWDRILSNIFKKNVDYTYLQKEVVLLTKLIYL